MLFNGNLQPLTFSFAANVTEATQRSKRRARLGKRLHYFLPCLNSGIHRSVEITFICSIPANTVLQTRCWHTTEVACHTGPKLYKEPSFKSNKFIIHNAITRCCLAGKVNEPQKNKIVEVSWVTVPESSRVGSALGRSRRFHRFSFLLRQEMEKSAANHFLILFRDASCQFRAVYTMNPETEEMVRLTGIGPRVIVPEMVESIYKYSSDRKQFTTIPSKTMSMSVDAFTIPSHFWQKRPGTPKKLGTPK